MSTTVKTNYGILEGCCNDGVYSWKGIPYAGKALRFKAAEEPAPWEGVRQAKSFGPVSPQISGILKSSSTGEIKESAEECLTLNIYSNNPSGKAPVFFFIHGGAFVAGAGLATDGSFFAKNDVVCVTINYRLGVFGCFDFSFLDEEFASNICIRDQAGALKWVYENIAAFGGDPENITLAGESAGAISSLALLNVPSVRKYFNKALIMSAFPEMFTDKESAETAAKKFLKRTEIGSKEELLAMPEEELNRRAVKFFAKGDRLWGMMDIKLSVDGFIANFPFEGAKKGEDAQVPIFFGTMNNEADFLANLPIIRKPVLREIEYRKSNYIQIGKIIDNKYAKKKEYGRLATDIMIKAPTEGYAYLHGQRQSVWLYRFCYAPRLLRLLGLGAIHALDVVFLFDAFKGGSRPWRKDQIMFLLTPNLKYARSVATRYQSDILEFVRNGRCRFDPYSKDFTIKCYGISDRGQTDRLETAILDEKRQWLEFFEAVETADEALHR